MRPGDKAALGRAIQGIAGKNAGTGCRARRHVLGTHSLPLPEVHYRHTGVLNVRSAGQTRALNRGSCRCVAELRPPRIALVHDPHPHLRSRATPSTARAGSVFPKYPEKTAFISAYLLMFSR